MNNNNNVLTIASRESRLALWQTNFVKDTLQKADANLQINILGMTTQGDKILDKPLSKIGGKGLFIKELETALLNHQADFAVHSMKDVPMEIPNGFALAAVMQREIPFDALVLGKNSQYKTLQDLPKNAVIGTSSVRREAILRKNFPHLQIKSLRGNLDTRLRKLDSGEFDAIILAAAGLKRLGLNERISQILPPEIFISSPGQGALGIEILAENQNILQILENLNDLKTLLCVTAEREFSKQLGGSCQIPLGAFACFDEQGQNISINGFIAAVDGTTFLQHQIKNQQITTIDQAKALGKQLAENLLSQGANKILADLQK